MSIHVFEQVQPESIRNLSVRRDGVGQGVSSDADYSVMYVRSIAPYTIDYLGMLDNSFVNVLGLSLISYLA